jgi:1,4-alpha-glucan branching enzyme
MIKKNYSKTSKSCKVTFELTEEVVHGASSVMLVGDFNNWSTTASPLKKKKNGPFSIVIPLEPGREYQFRYFIDYCKWENDWNADKYVPSPFGDSDNSVVIV